MKTDRIIFILGIIIILIGITVGYSTYGAPSEFGNETTTTCWVGGDDGNLNCIGNLTIDYGFFEGALMPRTSLSYDIGSGPLRWGDLYVSDISADDLSVYNIDFNGEITGPYGNFTTLLAGTISGALNWTDLNEYPVACPGGYAITQLNDSVTCSDYWVDVAGDTMTGDLNMSFNDITDVGRITMKKDGSIWFGSVSARIYSGATDYIKISADDTIDLSSHQTINIKPDNDLNNWIEFGIQDLAGTTGDRPYIKSYRANLELRPENGLVIVTGNLTAYNITASNFFGTFTGNSSIWSRAGTTITQTNSGDSVCIGCSNPSNQFVISDGTANYFTTDKVNYRTQIGASVNNVPTETLEIAGHLNFQTVIKPTTADLGNIVLTENLGGGTFVEGTYIYDVAYITADGHTSAVQSSTYQPDLTVSSDSSITLSGLPISPDPRVTGRRIFRTVTNGFWYRAYKVHDINNNVDTSWIDDYSGSLDTNHNNYNYPDTTAGTIKRDGVSLLSFIGISTFVGLSAGENTIGPANVGIGLNALQENIEGYKNVAVGGMALWKNVRGIENTAFGHEAIANDNSPYYNTVVGFNAMRYTFGDRNAMVGYQAGQGTSGSSSGSNNIFVGYKVGDNILGGANNNIIIGYDIDLQSATGDNELNIGNVIRGDLSTGNVNITANFTLGQKITFALGETIDNIVDGWVRITGGLNVTEDIHSNYSYSKNQVAQFHREAIATAVSADTWYNITFDLVIDGETIGNWYELTDSNSSVTINDFEGIIRIQGCIHPYNDNVGNQEATIYARVLVNGIEPRCLQRASSKDFKASGMDTIDTVGTVVVEDGDVITYQWRTTNTNLQLEGDSLFDNPVSASLNFERISNLQCKKKQ